MALAARPEVLGFRVPTESGKALLVWGLEEGAEHSLFSVFSEFGLLYSVRVHRNAAVAGPGYYALVKFYSARDASRAQRACNRQRLFQKSPLKVCICTRQKAFQQQVLALRSYRCKELANYYLGFNGWSNRIITLQNISGFDLENEELGGLPERQCLKYLCVVEVTLPHHGICTRGLAIAEAYVENGRENGKVAVEYNSAQEEPIDSLTDEELRGLIQINDLSLEQLNLEEEEEFLSDFCFDEEHLLEGRQSN
ncbi:RAD52 motif-containing protein 1 isoform X2 [Mauremys reevesii]|uniref:RAD52 motif-containing protein 1 isoform X2 n=1 Tax=Mauremys reevesii TaxID=260615 RepID=UPI00193F041E|nr:RAD52 motif-containing protein 1 isoform X2 [Mauremys reevesii]